MAQERRHIGHRQHTGERQQGQREGAADVAADIKGIAVLWTSPMQPPRGRGEESRRSAWRGARP